MCLIAFAWRAHPRYRLIVAANRDEFHERPTAMLHHWRENQEIVGGRDLRAGGSWLALRAGGRFAAITNVRESKSHVDERSRGDLVRDFLLGEELAASFAEEAWLSWARYGGFNLLLHDAEELIWVTNRPTPAWKSVMPGIHGLSNGLPSFAPVQRPWPKVVLGIAAMREWLRTIPLSGEPDLAPLFALLSNDKPFNDKVLPDTGIGLEMERALSPPFIRGRDYGTRSSTIVLISSDCSAVIVEHCFGPEGAFLGETRLSLPGS